MSFDSADFSWDPSGMLHAALWIGGAQWAGKSTVARILAARHGLTAYHDDYHDARGHFDRRLARQAAAGLALTGMPQPERWVTRQLRTLPRAGSLTAPVSDPARAQANRVARDRLLADQAVADARAHGIRVLEIDGSLDAEAVADEAAAHFARYLAAG